MTVLAGLASVRDRNLGRLFAPKHVAVLGASDDPKKVGARPIKLLRRYGFEGTIVPVNSKRDTIEGLPCVVSLDALTEVPDVVVFAVPAQSVVESARLCAKRGVGAIIVYTSGFGEVDEAGRQAEDELARISRETGMIICGPNCQGIANFHNGMVANFTSALMHEKVAPGPVALVTQSGLVGGLMVTACLQRDLGIGYLVSTGNEAGMTLADGIRHVVRDDRTRVIAGYVEQIRDLSTFRIAAEEARRCGKPIILLKVGRSPDAAEAAASHTGSLAGAAELYDAVFAEIGVVVADSLEELIDLTLGFSSAASLPDGPNLGVLTNSGGLGVFSADEAARNGLNIARFSHDTVAAIEARLFSFGSAKNPVDISTQAFSDPEAVKLYLKRIAADPAVDLISVTFGLQFLNAIEVAEAIAAAAANTVKPVLVSWVSSEPEALRVLSSAGIPVFSDPARAIRCAGRLQSFARKVAETSTAPASADPAPQEAAAWARLNLAETIGEADALAVFSKAGLNVPKMVMVETAGDAAVAFAALGAPAAVVKVNSPDIVHKSEAGGVKLDILSAEAAAQAAADVLSSARTSHPRARIDGIILATMVKGEAEAFIGARWDPLLGPFIIVGLGGIFVEVMEDVAIASAPASQKQIEAQIRRLKAFPILDGARGRPKTDWRALAAAAAAVSRLMASAEGRIAEIDLNPVILGREGEGVTVVDALIVPAEQNAADSKQGAGMEAA